MSERVSERASEREELLGTKLFIKEYNAAFKISQNHLSW